MTKFSDLANDHEFASRWPYIWSKLEPHLLEKQRSYAAAHKGDHEAIGRFVEFMSELFDDLNTIDIKVQAPPKPKRPSLHNKEFGQK